MMKWRVNVLVLSVVLWTFGLATTATLISTWGRAVASDPGVIDSAARELAVGEFVMDRLVGQVTDLAVGQTGDVGQLVVGVVENPEIEAALQGIMSDVVTAATATDGGRHDVDVADRLGAVAPVLEAEAQERGLPLDADQIMSALNSLEPITVLAAGEPPKAGPESPAAGLFTLATLLSSATMFLSGSLAVWMSEEPRVMLRSLMNRVMVSGLSFAVIMRLGAWLADPDGGSTPMRSALAVLIRSKTWIPLSAAAVAGTVAAYLWLSRKKVLDGPGIEAEEDRTDETPVLVGI